MKRALEISRIIYKAKLLTKASVQNKKIDFNEIFLPIIKITSIFILLSIRAIFDLELKQLDVTTTFLHRKLVEYIYVQ